VSFMNRVRWDEENCNTGIQRLSRFRPRKSKQLDVPSRNPLHDMSSHGSSAFMYLTANHDKLQNEGSWESKYATAGMSSGSVL
jgi:hypothetical protein